MYQSSRSSPLNSSALLESLEPRRMLSHATVTTIKASASTYVFGQTEVYTIKVETTKGKAVDKGTVEFLEEKEYIGVRAEVNSKGVATITFGPGDVFPPATGIAFSAHYMANSAFAASTSKHINVTVDEPSHLTTASDGLETEVITAGKGPAVVDGDTITIEEVGYNPAGQVIQETTDNPADFFTDTLPDTTQVSAGELQGLIGMRAGEVLDMAIPSALEGGNGKQLLVVELVSIDA